MAAEQLRPRGPLPATDTLFTTSTSLQPSSTTALSVASTPTSSSSAPVQTSRDNAPAFPTSLAGFSSSTTSSTASATPTGNDGDTLGVTNYYFVFIALIFCLGGLAGFLFWRRRRVILARVSRHRQDTARRDVHGWSAAGATSRPRHGYWEPDDINREEGLNEEGEAPPPYMPKTDEEAGQKRPDTTGRSDTARGGPGGPGGPAVPLQTLSRAAAGHRPPDYVAENEQSGQGEATPSVAPDARRTLPRQAHATE